MQKVNSLCASSTFSQQCISLVVNEAIIFLFNLQKSIVPVVDENGGEIEENGILHFS